MRAAILAGVLAAAAVAEARPIPQGGGWLHYELTGLHALEDDAGPPPAARDLLLAGARLHGFIGGDHVGYHVGIDLAAGATVNAGGFAYDVALFPLGGAVRLGRTGVFALGAGVGASGATGSLDDAATFPLEANLELGGGSVRVLARARAIYVAGAPARQNGALSLAFVDELDATVGIRIGRHYEQWGFPSGNGNFLGASYRELGGVTYVGIVIGYSIDGATAKRKPRVIENGGGCADCD